MKENEFGRQNITSKIGCVVKDVSVLFPVEDGGDITIEAGDLIKIELIKTETVEKCRQIRKKLGYEVMFEKVK